MARRSIETRTERPKASASWVALALAGALAAPAPLAVASAEAPAAALASDPQALALLQAVERRHSDVASLTCSFRQSFRSATTGQVLVEEGRIWVKRPGRMRWDYRLPDKKVFLVEPDGRTLSYVPADMTAVRDRVPEDAPHLQILLGRGNLDASFVVTSVKLKDALDPTASALKLTPRQPMPNIEWAYVEVDPATHAVGRVLVLDSLGNESDLVLSKIKENVPLKDDVFDVRLPAGINVREASGARAN